MYRYHGEMHMNKICVFKNLNELIHSSGEELNEPPITRYFFDVRSLTFVEDLNLLFYVNSTDTNLYLINLELNYTKIELDTDAASNFKIPSLDNFMIPDSAVLDVVSVNSIGICETRCTICLRLNKFVHFNEKYLLKIDGFNGTVFELISDHGTFLFKFESQIKFDYDKKVQINDIKILTSSIYVACEGFTCIYKKERNKNWTLLQHISNCESSLSVISGFQSVCLLEANNYDNRIYFYNKDNEEIYKMNAPEVISSGFNTDKINIIPNLSNNMLFINSTVSHGLFIYKLENENIISV